MRRGGKLDGREPERLDRREFFVVGSKKGLGLGLIGLAGPSLLAACGTDTQTEATTAAASPAAGAAAVEGTVVVGDVVDFALTSDEWQGDFGFATLRLHKGAVDGNDVYFIRTDASDQDFARTEGLVFVPKIGSLIGAGLTGNAYFFGDGAPDQATVLSSEPGRPDYTPAWRINRVKWNAQPRLLGSEKELRAARSNGDLQVQRTDIVLNAALVKWSGEEMPADPDLKEYLGGGQLIEAPDTSGMTVTFKLHECFPEVRYLVVDTSMEPMAAGMNVAHSPRLTDAPKAEATGRTNVFMNGIKGPGPMGFQPSVFDSKVGEEEWSPYWDHFTYEWKNDGDAGVLATEDEVHAARDRGELKEFPGTPDTKGAIFTVNCPVPVVAPNTFTG